MAIMTNQTILSIKIDNNNPIELNQLTLSLNALACQYDSFLRKSENFDFQKSERKLYISRLESGSLFAELVAPCLFIVNDLNPILEFGHYLKSIFDFGSGIKKEPPHGLTKKDCNELVQIIEPTASDSGGNMNITVTGNGNDFIIVNCNPIQANATQNMLKKCIDGAQELPNTYYKELMYWANAGFRENKINDKVIIEKIDNKPKKVIFSNDQDKAKATTHNKNFPNKNWQDLAYNVDVEVSYIQGVPKEYKIIKIYEDEIFDPNEL
jgi:hypothetical protein